jgi:hypothetical protein
MKNFVWVSFDLGVKGDYEGMYAWLDSHGAKECGDGLACFWYEHGGKLLPRLTKDFRDHVTIDSRSRIYVIQLVEGEMKGKFIIGRRRNPPWSGFAPAGEQSEDTDAVVH